MYSSNESEYIDVFFDNLVVQHYAGPLVEENQYYPFGLVQKGISSKAFGREKKVCGDSVFVEQYIVSSGGVYGGDRVSDYITDSSNFRFYVGTFDNAAEHISYECKGDSIYIEK